MKLTKTVFKETLSEEEAKLVADHVQIHGVKEKAVKQQVDLTKAHLLKL